MSNLRYVHRVLDSDKFYNSFSSVVKRVLGKHQEAGVNVMSEYFGAYDCTDIRIVREVSTYFIGVLRREDGDVIKSIVDRLNTFGGGSAESVIDEYIVGLDVYNILDSRIHSVLEDLGYTFVKDFDDLG